MGATKPAVWVCTTLRSFKERGLTSEEAFRRLPEHYRKPIEELAAQPDLPWDIQMVVRAGGSIFRERCRYATEFMERAGEDDILLMVDFDLPPTGQQYVDILCRMAKLDVCGGLYTTRDRNGQWVVSLMSGEAPSPSGLLRVIELGTGFKAFRRSVFDRVLARNPWLKCSDDIDQRIALIGFFSAGPIEDVKHWPGRRRLLTEDYWFDWLCREAGIDIVCDTRIKIRHRDEETGELYPAQFPDDPGVLPMEAKEL